MVEELFFFLRVLVGRFFGFYLFFLVLPSFIFRIFKGKHLEIRGQSVVARKIWFVWLGLIIFVVVVGALITTILDYYF
jgi:hypothetical protein